MVRTYLISALLCAVLLPAPATAQFSFDSYVSDDLPGHVVNDLYVDFTGDTPIFEMLLSAPGKIFQHPGGDPMGGPLPFGTSFFGCGVELPASLCLDSFVTLGVEEQPFQGTVLLIAGGAVDLGGAAAATFDESLLDITWAPAGGQTFPSTGAPQLIARVTLADDTDGVVALFLQDARGSSGALEFLISGGLIVPEPSSMAMFAAAGLLVLLRRR